MVGKRVQFDMNMNVLDLSDIELLEYFTLKTNFNELVISVYVGRTYPQFIDNEWIETDKEIYDSGIIGYYKLTQKAIQDLANYKAFKEL